MGKPVVRAVTALLFLLLVTQFGALGCEMPVLSCTMVLTIVPKTDDRTFPAVSSQVVISYHRVVLRLHKRILPCRLLAMSFDDSALLESTNLDIIEWQP